MVSPTIHACGPADAALVQAASHLLDAPAQPEWTDRFLTTQGHHLLLASVALSGSDAAEFVGFVSGVEIHHPDKGTEMLLYELGVDEVHRRQGVGRSLVQGLIAIAQAAGCRGMWVPLDRSDTHYEAALATYRSAGADDVEDAAICTWHWGE
jgi:ribosomal protein S18 acetylase RimI-like enzyme